MIASGSGGDKGGEVRRLDRRRRLGQGTPVPTRTASACQNRLPRQKPTRRLNRRPNRRPRRELGKASIGSLDDFRAPAAAPDWSGPDDRGLRRFAARSRYPRGDAAPDRLERRRLGVSHPDSAHGHGPEARGARSVETGGREPVGAGGPRDRRGARRHRGDRLGARPGQEHDRLAARPGISRWSARRC